MNNEPKQYGFFSQKAFEAQGCVYYTDVNGREVRVTTISPDPEAKDYNWDDKKFVSEVVNLVRTEWKDRMDGFNKDYASYRFKQFDDPDFE